MWFSCPSFPQTEIQMISDCYVLKLVRPGVDGKNMYLIGFQSENSVFKFLQRSVDEAYHLNDT